jgi:hypothetical protein
LPPPAIYSGKALVRISDREVFRGRPPRKQAKMVRDWANLRHAELMENWWYAANGRPLVLDYRPND